MAARLPDIGTFSGHQMLGVTLPPPPPPPLPPLPPPPPPPPPPSSVIIEGSLHTPTIYRPAFSPISHRDAIARNSKNHLPSRDTGNSNRQQSLNCGFKRPLQTDSSNGVKKIKSETLVDSPDSNLSSSVSENSVDPNNSESSSQNISAPGEAIQRIRDSSYLPKELTKLFGALKCDLCSVTVNSTIQAKMHYIGKQHEKKVNAFLIKWCKETGQPMPNVNAVTSKTKKSANPDDLFCKVCNIALTSIQHAQQHYMGRNHSRVVNGHTPLKPGYFNKDTGKWQRLPQFEKVDPAGRFGIGVAFVPETPANSVTLESDAPTSSNVGDVKSPSKNRRFFCELCQVATTSQDQLDMHLKGAKHRKAERIAATSGNSSQPVQSNIPLPSTPSDSILASVMKTNKADKNKSGIKDYSIYRTPSGQFYCQPCNLTLNSESQFSQHCESRKHKLAMLKKPANKGIGRGSLNLK